MKKINLILGIICLIFLSGCIAKEPVSNINETNETVSCFKPCHLRFSDLNDSMPSCTTSEGACTEEYLPQDACLELITCKTENQTCKTEIEEGFMECMSCFKECLEMSEDNADTLVCQSMCNPKE